jgi:hypothetical protein
MAHSRERHEAGTSTKRLSWNPLSTLSCIHFSLSPQCAQT